MAAQEDTARYALLSVWNKTGIVSFAHNLWAELGFSIISTGGTAELLTKHGIPVQTVEEYTESPEMMGGRVKTLHPLIFGGILGREEDVSMMVEHGMVNIDLVVVNLYPFQETVSRPGCTFATAIENIDVGGPSMLRAAAKNHMRVGAICDPNDYGSVLTELFEEKGKLTGETRLHLCRKVFAHTTSYEAAVNEYLSR